MVTVLILLIALGVLGWGLYRSLPLGKFGVLAWLQSVLLMAPWLLFFALFAVGIYLNLAAVLLLLLISITGYVLLGRRLRSLSQDPQVQEKMAMLKNSTAPSASSLDATSSTDETAEGSPAKSVTPSEETANLDVIPMPAEDLKAVQGIFGIDTFFATETLPYQEGVIFKGNLRGEAADVHEQLSSLLKDRVGDRYNLFLVPAPDSRPTIVVLPSRNGPQPSTTAQRLTALLLALLTFATCMETAGLFLGFDLLNEASRYSEAFPLGIGIVLILAAHELGHWLTAERYQVRLSPPFFIPTWQIGSFGALTRFETLLKNRSILFDISLAGPAVGGVVSLVALVIGLVLSGPNSLFQVPTEFFQGSILVGMLARIVLGEGLQQSIVSIHPLTILGWLGLVITALNLMPAGQLDGGRVMQAVYGRKVARWSTIITLIVLGIATFANPLALYWAVLILFLQRGLERPCLEEISEPDDARAALGLLAFFLMAATLLPVTPALAGRLGIGG
ncbi:MAG: site-2 protease family protein [Leptolyngbya sp. DLM2.Bin15]|nr:MAG: site-2 protease family protein [Leptolyngbya sp. DLM2.Bin15]